MNMKLIARFIAIPLLLALIASTGFGWGNATHSYYSKHLGARYGPPNLNEMYGSVLVDAFNLVMTEQGQFLADQFHHNPFAIIHSASNCSERAAAYGFASHNDNWGADWTAHHKARTLHGGGYAILKGQQLAPTLIPVLYQILRNATPPVPEPIAEALAYSLAPEFGHDLSETAVDLMIKKYEDPAVGARILFAAQYRSASVPQLLCRAYAQLVADAFQISLAEACGLITTVEGEYRNQMMQYGQAFLLPENATLQALAQMSASIAEQYLEYYAYINGSPADVTVSAETAESFIRAAINVVKYDYRREVHATLAYVDNQLDRRGVRTCRLFGKEGEEIVSSPETPAEYSLRENFPNPFNPSTTIRFSVPATSVVSLEIYNIIGQKVRTLIDAQSYEQGRWDVVWNGKNDAGLSVPSGTYISRLTTPGGVFSRKMIMMK